VKSVERLLLLASPGESRIPDQLGASFEGPGEWCGLRLRWTSDGRPICCELAETGNALG